MKIHVVQPLETIESIAALYGVTPTSIIRDNEINPVLELIPGQTLVIVYPIQTYTIQEGDSLSDIAQMHQVTVVQLLRYNPHLSDREALIPGEIITIRYDNSKGRITTNGYVNPFIRRDILRKTLPNLTYLSIFGYRTTEDAEIIGIDDTEIIQMAKNYGVAPIMLLSTLTYQGEGSLEVSRQILSNPELTDRHIENILIILREKKYYGLNITFQFLNKQNSMTYEVYTIKLKERLSREGFLVFITLVPEILLDQNNVAFERINYSVLGEQADGITMMNYNWGFSYGPPDPVSSIYLMRTFLNYALTMIDPAKIDIGMPIIGYDWELPYIPGITRANSLTLTSVLDLAREYHSTIYFNEQSKTPYFQFATHYRNLFTQHIVWFIDARSIDALVHMVQEYQLAGTGIWNIMNYYPQMWLVINSQYEIESIPL